ncbi:MAG: hypothetical protein K0Q79_1001 [Flavipsychrobacter sp.]|jgi:hypothetical protein|nr:hypothetical protein [Flavipsychrobacter sp.]
MSYCFDITQIILAVVGVIGGTSFLTYKVTKNSHNKKTINQNRNVVNGGDIVGGNKTTNK